MQLERCASFLIADNPLIRIVQVLIVLKPNGFGPRDNLFDGHPPTQKELPIGE